MATFAQSVLNLVQCPCKITMSERNSIEARSVQRYWKTELCKDALDEVCSQPTCVQEEYVNVNLTMGGFANYTLQGCGQNQLRYECSEVLSVKHYLGSSKVSLYFRVHCKEQGGCESAMRALAYGDVPGTGRVKDLETAVSSDCDFNTVRLLAENRSLTDELRSPTWQNERRHVLSFASRGRKFCCKYFCYV
ncbi:Neural cell expressed developmentally down-regula ted protein 1 [Trichuris trichiura]|uniref:Neural cell expressed developmentally down-regula ted protein 1 n=1 Tax=Trichuris trichiura TaxID=36087 RepID=A0A077ZH27_TRITR|nr:Neural cell expressed developmentally down-regula ted protein 1 [Trichuris trichiura]